MATAPLNKVRLDKWLWSVRIFKSRTQATDACKAGKIKLEGVVLKPSHMVQQGDLLEVRKGGFVLQYKVLELIEKRVSAPLAQACYQDLTPEEELNKYNAWFIGKARPEVREKGAGRPTKRDRRVIDEFKTFDDDEDGDF